MDEITIFREIYEANQSPDFDGIGGDLSDVLLTVREHHKVMTKSFSGREAELAEMFRDTHDLGKYGVCRKTGWMPRGYFCPSPVLELCVGGVFRGSLRKTVDVKDGRLYFCYRVDETGRIRVITEYSGAKEIRREYLFYCGDRVLGIGYSTQRRNDNTVVWKVSSISEERYRDGRIVEYIRSYGDESVWDPNWIVMERYFYSEEALRTCLFWQLQCCLTLHPSLEYDPEDPELDYSINGWRNDFEVQNGYFTSRTGSPFIRKLGDYQMSDTAYPVKFRRKACP